MSEAPQRTPPLQRLGERLRAREGRELAAFLAFLAGLALCGFGVYGALRGEFVFIRAAAGTIYRGTVAYLLAAGMVVGGVLLLRFAVDPWRRENRELDDPDEWRLR